MERQRKVEGRKWIDIERERKKREVNGKGREGKRKGSERGARRKEREGNIREGELLREGKRN
jgi:hypothetical protein